MFLFSPITARVITDTGAPKLIEAAKKAGVQIIADPKLTGLHRSVGADWVLFQKQGLEIMRKRLGVLVEKMQQES